MSVLIALIFLIALPAGIAWALAVGLGRLQTNWSLRRRTMVSALAAGLVPVAIPVIAVMLDGWDSESFIAIAALLFTALIIALVVGLPIALYIGRKLAAQHPDSGTFN